MRTLRGREFRAKARRLAVLVVFSAAARLEAGAAEAPTRKPLNLYEWMAVAPIVVAGEVREDDAKLLTVDVRASCRGSVSAEERIQVDERRANRERESGTPALELKKGESYLLLLAPHPESKAGRPNAYVLVRGTSGARPLPAEGSQLWIDAAARLCRLLDARDDVLVWQELGEGLSSANPVLVATALEMHVKFQRGALGLLPRLRELFADARPDFRADAATLAGQILTRGDWRSDPYGEATVGDLIGLARRDAEVDVRVRATRALGGISGTRITEALREIAREDPEQAVRYAAERSIFERGEKERTTTPTGGRPSCD